jgi:hypothetical protein
LIYKKNISISNKGMSLALFASPVECKDDYLENKINKEKAKLSFQSLQTQLKPSSAHGAYNALHGKDSDYNMNAVYNIHQNVKEESEQELSNFYQNEKEETSLKPVISTNQYMLMDDQDKVPAKKIDSVLVDKIDRLMEMLEEQSEIKTTKKNEEIVLYCFLGIFTIYVLDSFASIGKYSR